MSSLLGGAEGPEEPWDRQVWLDEHCLKVMGEGDIAWVCHCGSDFRDDMTLDAGLARQHDELSQEHQT